MSRSALKDQQKIFEQNLAMQVTVLRARAEEFSRSTWTGTSRSALEKAIILTGPSLSATSGLPQNITNLCRTLEACTRSLLAQMKTVKIENGSFDRDTEELRAVCDRLLIALNQTSG